MKQIKNIRSSAAKAFVLWLLVVGGIVQTGQSQQILWEKYWPNVRGQFDAMVQGDSGFYYGVGVMKVIRNYNQPVQFQDTLEGVILVKLTEEGDTVWFRKICNQPSNLVSDVAFMEKGADGILHIGMVSYRWSELEYRIYNAVPTTGFSFLAIQIPYSTAPTLYGMTQDGADNLYLYGEREQALFSGIYEMFCIKINSAGMVVYDKGFSPGGHPSCAAQYAEPMPGGKLRLSGNKGKTIVVFELDSLGNTTHYQEFIDNPFGFVQQTGAFVQQAERGYFLVSNLTWDGSSSASATQSYISKVDSVGNIIWSQTRTGAIARLSPNSTGGYLVAGSYLGNLSFESNNINNQPIWSVNTTSSSIPGIKWSEKLLFLNDNTGIGYGYNFINGRYYPFAMKVGNVGYPVDPSNPQPPVLAVSEPVSASWLSRAYPNPTTGRFQFVRGGQLRLVNPQGQILLEQSYLPGQTLDISHLPPGVYLYSLLGPEGKGHGRIVKTAL